MIFGIKGTIMSLFCYLPFETPLFGGSMVEQPDNTTREEYG